VRLFEIGHVYPPGEGDLPGEYEALTVVLAGADATEAVAVWRELATNLGTGARLNQGLVPAGLHATRSATLQAGKDPLGTVGEVAPDVIANFDVSERVAILEINLDQMLSRKAKPAQWKLTSRQPSSDLDLAFVLEDSVEAVKLEKAIRTGAGKLLVGLALFDVYRGESLGANTRSLAYRLRLQATDRSLTDADTADVRRGVEAAATKLGAELRS
jgi:phenylalanyl-tRNA synthetase beta chain